MNREETKEAIQVMQHYADGGEVEFNRHSEGGCWEPLPEPHTPSWDWPIVQYRIKPEPREWWIDPDDYEVWIDQDTPPVLNAIKVREVL
jgi:hypothetical protein